MTIYVISPYESSVEGRGTRNIYLAKVLRKLNEVEHVTTRFSHTNKYFHSKAAFAGSDEVCLSTMGYSKNLSVKRLLAHWVTAIVFMWYLIRKLKSGDVVIVSSIPPELVLAMSLVATVMRASMVLDVRDIWPDAFPIKGRIAGFFSFYCRALYTISRSLKKPDYIIYVAPSFLNWIDKYYPSVVNRAFIPLGYDELRWERQQEELDYTFVYIGFLESQFDLSIFLKELRAFGDMKMAVVGNGSRLSHYQNIIAGSGQVEFKGVLSQGEASAVVCSSRVGLLPVNHSAQMPNKLFDYIGAGIPILCVGDSDAAKFVIDNDIGWSVPFDGEKISRFLQQLSNTDIALKAGRVRDLRNSFSKRNLYESYSNLVGSLVGNPET